MEQDAQWEGSLDDYLRGFGSIIGDKRTGETFEEVIKGVIASGSLVLH